MSSNYPRHYGSTVSSVVSTPVRYLESMLWAACCLAYFGFLCCGEFTCSPNSPRWLVVVSIRDISVDSHSNPRILLLHLRHSKTDHFGKWVTIVMGWTDSFLCPVASVLSFIARHHPSPCPLFMFKDDHPLSRDVFIGKVKMALTQAGINTSQYSGHSFRIGAATAAAKAGIGDAVIQQLGRWKSSAYTRYIRPPHGDLGGSFRLHGLPTFGTSTSVKSHRLSLDSILYCTCNLLYRITRYLVIMSYSSFAFLQCLFTKCLISVRYSIVFIVFFLLQTLVSILYMLCVWFGECSACSMHCWVMSCSTSTPLFFVA